MKTPGEDMLGKAIKTKKRATKKRGMVAGALGAYKDATTGLQNVGKEIRSTVSGKLATDSKILNQYGGGLKAFQGNPLALNPSKRKRQSKRK